MAAGVHGLEIESPPPVTVAGLAALFDYWQELGAQAGGLPALRDFDALHLPRLLPHMWVAEVEPESGRFRMRLAGESINAIYRRSIARKYFAEVFEPTEIDAIMARYKRALSEPAIYYAKGYVYAAAGQYCTGERLGLPMLGGDGGTRILLGATYYGHRADESVPLSPVGDTAQFHAVRAANHRAVEIVGG